MSRMLSTSKVAAVLALCSLGPTLSGCSRFDVNSPQIRGIAYVRVDDVVRHDPMYPQLSHIDDAIAMVDLAGAGPRVPHSAAEIAREDARIRTEVAAARARTQQIVTSKQREYAAREQAAVTAALSAAGVRNASNVAATMGHVSLQQQGAAVQQAGRDYAAFQQSVVSQSNDAARGIVHQLQQQANEKLQAKAMQEQQRETNLSLQLSQQDAAKRLSIQTKLSMLALDNATRRQLQAQLAAMTRRENDVLSAQRAADRREFTAFRATVMAQTNQQMQAQVSSIRTETQAKLVARRSIVGAQLRGLAGPASVPHLTPATQAQIRSIAQRFQQQYQTDIQGVLSEYAQNAYALEAQYAALQGADAAASGATAQEVAVLQQRRQTLYDQIVGQVEREAQRLAKEKGFRVVFSNVTAAPGGYDMTNELIHDIESEHE
ncbi:MAG: OmpH family outer membrane protein [Candidatus Tyrphobacter sp.]